MPANSQPFAQIKLLDYQFWIGDGRLQSVEVDLGEDERASNCRFTFYDPDLSIASYLFQLSQASGGITYPSDLLQDFGQGGTPNPSPTPSPQPSPQPQPDPETPSPSPSPSPSPPTTPSQDGVSGETSTGIPLSAAPEGTKGDALARYIIKYCNHPKIGVTSLNHQAYILATMTGETSNGVYLSEIGGSSKSYAPWYGRGIVQLTHKSNYEKAGQKLGVDFVSGENRELVKQLKYAIPILVIGMRDGWFTGKKLSDYGA